MPSSARLVTLPFCRVVVFGDWNESPRRRFAAYRCREDGAPVPRLLGHAVVDEFATLSSPIFFCANELAGKIYDAGITLAHRRDPEMAIDHGWPPLVVASASSPLPAGELPATWQEDLLAALRAPAADDTGAVGAGFHRRAVGADQLDWARLGGADVLVTSAPLLPKQLGRLCETSPLPFAVAVSTARPLVRVEAGRPRAVPVASEERLGALVSASRRMLAPSVSVEVV